MKTMLQNYLNSLRVYDMSQYTISCYENRLNKFINYKQIESLDDFLNIRLDDLEGYLSYLGEIGNCASTKQNEITAINSFCEYLVNHDYMETNPCSKLKRIKIEQKEQTYLTDEESLKMIDISNTGCKRTSAIIALCLQCGLRVSEVINLQKENIYLENGKWNIHIVKAKGKKDRIVYLDEYTKSLIDDYMSIRKNDNEYDNVFISNQNTPMNADAFNRKLKDVCKKTGIEKNITVHSLRRTMATRLNDKDVPLTYIQKILGHANYSTTLGYIKVDKEKVAERVIRASLHPVTI